MLPSSLTARDLSVFCGGTGRISAQSAPHARQLNMTAAPTVSKAMCRIAFLPSHCEEGKFKACRTLEHCKAADLTFRLPIASRLDHRVGDRLGADHQ